MNTATEFAYCYNCETHTGWFVEEHAEGTEYACDTCEEMWIEETNSKEVK